MPAQIKDFSKDIIAQATALLDQRMKRAMNVAAERIAVELRPVSTESPNQSDQPILANSIVTAADGSGTYFVGSTDERMLAIEKGTSKTEARPVIQNTLLEMVPRMQQILEGKS